MQSPKTSSGFTLIELLIVISLISLLSSIILTSLTIARAKAANARTVATVRAAQSAFSMRSLNAASEYPNPGNTDSYTCLTKSDQESCIFWGTTVNGSSAVASELAPYIQKIPNTEAVTIDGLAYNAIVYKCKSISAADNTCTAGALYWPEKGVTICTVGTTVVAGSGGVVCGQNAGNSGTDHVESQVQQSTFTYDMFGPGIIVASGGASTQTTDVTIMIFAPTDDESVTVALKSITPNSNGVSTSFPTGICTPIGFICNITMRITSTGAAQGTTRSITVEGTSSGGVKRTTSFDFIHN